jgi:hypothetical protein
MTASPFNVSPTNSTVSSSNPLKRPRDASAVDAEQSSCSSSPKRSASEDPAGPSSPGASVETDGMDIDSVTEIRASESLEARTGMVRLGDAAAVSDQELSERWAVIEGVYSSLRDSDLTCAG